MAPRGFPRQRDETERGEMLPSHFLGVSMLRHRRQQGGFRLDEEMEVVGDEVAWEKRARSQSCSQNAQLWWTSTNSDKPQAVD